MRFMIAVVLFVFASVVRGQSQFRPVLAFSTAYVDMVTPAIEKSLNVESRPISSTQTHALRMMAHFGHEVEIRQFDQWTVLAEATFGLGRRQALNSNTFTNATMTELHPQFSVRHPAGSKILTAYIGRAISLSADAPSTNRFGSGMVLKNGNQVSVFASVPARKGYHQLDNGETHLSSRYVIGGVGYRIALR